MTSTRYSSESLQFNINGTDVLRLQNPGSSNASVIFNGTRAITLPVGNNSTDRPTTPTAGMLRYQNTTNNLEFYNGTSWNAVGSGTVVTQWKEPVRVATTAPGTLASSFENGDVIDGVTLVTGDRILIKNQTAAAENGIYIVNATGAPTRASDMNSWDEVPGATVFVNTGTVNADQFWFCTSNPGGTLDTTAINWSQISGSGTLQSAYNGSTSGEIIVDSTRIAFKIRDNTTPVLSNLFEVQNNSGSVNYFAVDAQGAKLSNGTAPTPSMFFASDPNTGVFRPGADTFGITANGQEIARFNENSLDIGRNATVANVINDPIGSWDFSGYDGSNYIPAASVSAEVDATPGTADMPGRLIFSTTADGASIPTERMRINSKGEITTPNDAGNIGGKIYAYNNFI